MSIWQFNASFGGFVTAHVPDDGSISKAEAEALSAALDEPPVWQ